MVKKINQTKRVTKKKIKTAQKIAVTSLLNGYLDNCFGVVGAPWDDEESEAPARFIKIDDTEWTFDFSIDYQDYFQYLFKLDGMDLSVEDLKKEYLGIIDKMPEVFDASRELAEIYWYEGKKEDARHLYEQALQIARRYIPKAFIPGEHTIPWASLENRPFLRLFAGYAALIEALEGVEQAIPLYKELMSFNPNDNQGIRDILATTYLQLGQPENLIELASHYPKDISPAIAVGRILALYQIGEKNQAKKQVLKCGKHQKNVFAEIVKKVHPKPKSVRDDGLVSVGGKDQAWHYWQDQGIFWMSSPVAREFLKECLEKGNRGQVKTGVRKTSPKNLIIALQVQEKITQKIDVFNKQKGCAYSFQVKGKFIYLSCDGDPIGRCTYNGDLENMEFAIYKSSTEKYDLNEYFPGEEYLDGTLEGAMKAGLESY